MNRVRTKKRIWSFLNSNFGLWLLSSVMVGLITFGYTKLNDHLAEKRLKERQVVKLDIEIEGRFYQLLEKIKRNSESLNIDTTNNPVVKNMLFEFKGNPTGENERFYSIYPEFQNRSIVSLIIELSSISENKKDVEKMKEVSKCIFANKFIPLNIENTNDIIDTIDDKLILNRWRKYWLKEY